MSFAMKYAMNKRSKRGEPEGMAEGGMVKEEEASGYQPMPMEAPVKSEEEEDDDLVMRIMKKRYSEGGMVANDTPPIADSEPADFDVLATDDDLEFSEDGKNSGDEDGNADLDEDDDDIVKRVMKSRAKKDKMPRPA